MTPAATTTNPIRRRRPRRREEDIRRLILDAAREEFSRNGYAATTTRAIALRADVSESLLFRYFGPKAALFDEVAFGPFDALMARFFQSHEEAVDGATILANTRAFVTELTDYLRANRTLVRSILQTPAKDLEPERGRPSAGLEDYFQRATRSVAGFHRGRTSEAAAGVGLSVRLGFGMVLSSILFSDWLFPVAEPAPEALAEGLVAMLVAGLTPPGD